MNKEKKARTLMPFLQAMVALKDFEIWLSTTMLKIMGDEQIDAAQLLLDSYQQFKDMKEGLGFLGFTSPVVAEDEPSSLHVALYRLCHPEITKPDKSEVAKWANKIWRLRPSKGGLT